MYSVFNKNIQLVNIRILVAKNTTEFWERIPIIPFQVLDTRSK